MYTDLREVIIAVINPTLATALFSVLIIIVLLVFMLAFYGLMNFGLRKAKEINQKKTGLNKVILLSKMFLIFFISFSFFLYSASFLFRIENNIFQWERQKQLAEETIIFKEGSLLLPKEIYEPPLFDFVIKSAIEQSQENSLTLIFLAGGTSGLIAVLAMMIYIARRERLRNINN